MQSIQTPRIVPAFLVLALLLAAQAASAEAPKAEGGHPQPTSEALSACESLESGNECSFSSDTGTTKGTCWAPEGKPLACKPAGGPPNRSSPPTMR